MTHRFQPLYDLRITTPRLELRVPDPETLEGLAEVAAAGVHRDDEMPFSVPWSAAPPLERGRATVRHVLGTLAQWRSEDWTLALAVLHEGRPVGRMDLTGRDFAVTREASTGSWLGLAHQGAGLGTEMRAAVLHLAFGELGALAVTSSAMTDNPRSLGVSRRLGYREDGEESAAVSGRRRTLRRLRLDRATWTARAADAPAGGGVRIEGLEGCREMFGV
ncbi:GNAT family N-acetyltransferase [Streptomyces sp. ST2-7A]|uniref:GNAT family N-acetyltransferase n=1 Tax=Streptomyces sp. ST2-7A TaxID=2907214 RepID=UPI001F26CF73|nr:GNAT family protein [Streptomyces sp. ST2-7A]MCE7083022.1 GNAT family N-acetyltransferase [Streptomyces sp. ST2-7A]